MVHHTVQPSDVSREIKAERLARELDALDVVDSAVANRHVDGLVNFEVDSTHLRASVMRVLADHGATVTSGCLESDLSFQTVTASVPRE
jgi:hypothetical protein